MGMLSGPERFEPRTFTRSSPRGVALRSAFAAVVAVILSAGRWAAGGARSAGRTTGAAAGAQRRVPAPGARLASQGRRGLSRAGRRLEARAASARRAARRGPPLGPLARRGPRPVVFAAHDLVPDVAHCRPARSAQRLGPARQ